MKLGLPSSQADRTPEVKTWGGWGGRREGEGKGPFRKELLGTGLKNLGSEQCLEALMMGEGNGKNKPSGSRAVP